VSVSTLYSGSVCGVTDVMKLRKHGPHDPPVAADSVPAAQTRTAHTHARPRAPTREQASARDAAQVRAVSDVEVLRCRVEELVELVSFGAIRAALGSHNALLQHFAESRVALALQLRAVVKSGVLPSAAPDSPRCKTPSVPSEVVALAPGTKMLNSAPCQTSLLLSLPDFNRAYMHDKLISRWGEQFSRDLAPGLTTVTVHEELLPRVQYARVRRAVFGSRQPEPSMFEPTTQRSNADGSAAHIPRSAHFWHVLNAQRQRGDADVPTAAAPFKPRAASAPAHLSAHALYFESSLKSEDLGGPSLGAEMEAATASAKGLRVHALAAAHERASAHTSEGLAELRTAMARGGTQTHCVRNLGEGRAEFGARGGTRAEQQQEVLRRPLAREIMQAMAEAEAEGDCSGGGTFGYKQVLTKVQEVVQARQPAEQCSLASFHATFKLFLSEQLVARCDDRPDHFQIFMGSSKARLHMVDPGANSPPFPLQLVRAEATNASVGLMAAIQARMRKEAAKAAAMPPPVIAILPEAGTERCATDKLGSEPVDGGDHCAEGPADPDSGGGDDWTPPEVDAMVVRARKKFDMLDADGSGMLDGAELEKLTQWVWSAFHPDGQPLSADELAVNSKKILRRVDSNEDGKMDFAEFEMYFRKTAAAISKYRRGAAEKRRNPSSQPGS
jgi:hypothetical protein